MHELSIAISLVEAAEEEALKHRATARPASRRCTSGSVRWWASRRRLYSFSYGLAAEDTPLQGSQLIIEEVPVMVFCAACRQRRPIRSLQSFCCATCKAPATDVVQGRELEVVAVEIRP